MTLQILLLEDSETDAELIVQELGKLSERPEVRRVGSRLAFEEALRGHTPDLIISDHNLPQFSGRVALEIVRTVAPHVPFILVTGSLDEEIAVDYMKAGAADYVLKDRMRRLSSAVLGALERARARAARRHADELLRQVIDANPNLIFVKDWEGRFVLVNQATADIYGTTVEGLVGKTDADFNPVEEEVAHFLRNDREVMTSGRPKPITEERVTNPATGDTRWFQTIKVPLLLPGDTTPRLLGVATDISERKQLELQFRQAQKMEAIGRLAGGVAHDFNNILTAILGHAGLLLEDLAPGDPHREDVEEVLRSAERAAGLTRQLLAFSRKQILQAEVLDFNAVVANIEPMLRRLIGDDVELRTSLAPGLGAIRADSGQLEQVLLNLVVNARDAMPQGGKITIETGDVELDEAYARRHVAVVPGPYVMLAVSDTGVGMDADLQAHLFEPFFTTKAPGKGTGLGLSTVYGVVKQSGGNIWVYSEPGKGATFKVYLPRVEGVPATAPRTPGPTAVGGTETILIAEDADAVRELACRVLRAHGYAVLEARQAPDALEIARGHTGPIHLLLTDVVMPELSGRELARRLEALRPGVPVLYMSGYADDAIVNHGMLEPGLAYLPKPFTPQALVRKVREVLDRG